jgi:hypothetical protein
MPFGISCSLHSLQNKHTYIKICGYFPYDGELPPPFIYYYYYYKKLRVCLVACIYSESLSPLIHAPLKQVGIRFFHLFGSLGLLKQAVLRCCLVGCPS